MVRLDIAFSWLVILVTENKCPSRTKDRTRTAVIQLCSLYLLISKGKCKIEWNWVSLRPARTGNTEIKMVIPAWGKGANHFLDYELMNFGENDIGKWQLQRSLIRGTKQEIFRIIREHRKLSGNIKSKNNGKYALQQDLVKEIQSSKLWAFISVILIAKLSLCPGQQEEFLLYRKGKQSVCCNALVNKLHVYTVQ